MLNAGNAVKVSIYLSEGATHHGVPVYASILDFLFYRGVAGATVLKGVAGFGADHHLHTASMVDLSDRLPIKIEFIEAHDKVDALLGKLQQMAGSGMIELQETTVAKPATPSHAAPLAPWEHLKSDGKARMMRILIDEQQRWLGKPLHLALLEALRANEIAAATVLRGIAGFRSGDSDHSPHSHRLMLTAVDSAQKLEAFVPLLDLMVADGLIVFSDVEVINYAHRPMPPAAETLS